MIIFHCSFNSGSFVQRNNLKLVHYLQYICRSCVLFAEGLALLCSTCASSMSLPPCVHLCTVFACVLVFVYLESFHFSHLLIPFFHLMQEAEQPLGAGVYDTSTFSKPISVKQVIYIPTCTNNCQSSLTIFRAMFFLYMYFAKIVVIVLLWK